jgi:mRNA-degrading endonuclease RelE of RelBE toxin-antitoxin system
MVKFTPEAFSDLGDFEEEIRRKLLDEVKEQLEESREDAKITVIQRPSYGAEFPRLKLTAEELNHRVYFDYVDSEIYVFAVRHREAAYSTEDIKEAIQRLDNLR